MKDSVEEKRAKAFKPVLGVDSKEKRALKQAQTAKTARERKQWEARGFKMNVPIRVEPEIQKPQAGDDGTSALDKLIHDGLAAAHQAKKEFHMVTGRRPSL